MTSIVRSRSAPAGRAGRPLAAFWPFGAPARNIHRARDGRTVLTVRELVTPAPVRIAEAVAGAAIVRDVAAFAALIVLATMLAVLSSADVFV